MKNTLLYFTILIMLMVSCIGDDFIDDRVDPVIRITNAIDSLALDSTYQFQTMYLNNVGKEEDAQVTWSSSDVSIISITADGLASALGSGSAEILAEFTHEEGTVMDSHVVGVGERTVAEESVLRSGTVNTTTFYELMGEFTMEENADGDIVLSFGEDYVASDALPGLYVYLSNNPNTINGAHEIQEVNVFKGAHNYTISGVGLQDFGYVLYFCKPFNVKVGHGKIED